MTRGSASQRSGTDATIHSNTQWMVIDMAAERPATGAWRDVLWIAEQAPGLVLAQDVSEVLQEQGYWASYK